jgi:hypothetical protein
MTEQQVPPLRSPGFPVELGGVDALHAPFPYRKAHTRRFPAQRGRKPRFAPVGMTHLFGVGVFVPKHLFGMVADTQTELPSNRRVA